MDFQIISHALVAMIIHKNESFDLPEAGKAIRSALNVCGYEPWSRIELELIDNGVEKIALAVPGGGETGNDD